MRSPFNPADWYWLADDGRVFASARAQVVTTGDVAYRVWLEQNERAQRWPEDEAGAQTDAALVAVLEPLGLAFAEAVLPAADLVAYANARQWALATGGFVATIKGQAVPFATTESALGLMDGKVMRLAQPNPPASVNWQVGPSSFAAIAADAFVAAALKVSDFVQATFDALPAVFAGIAAGTIKTRAQIDAVAWPVPTGTVS